MYIKSVLVSGIMLFSAVAPATTVLTDQNITKLEAALPELLKIKTETDLSKLRLAKHCDWPKHAADLKANPQAKRYFSEVETVLEKHQLTNALFLELSLKGAWPVVQSMLPMLNITRQSLPLLPEPQRNKAEQTLAQTDYLQQLIEPCLTDDDRNALQQYSQRLFKIAGQLPGLTVTKI